MLHSGDKTQYGFLVASGCVLSRKVWWVVRIGSFWPKLRYFIGQNGPNWGEAGGHIKMNFGYFQIQKWMLQTVRAEKVDEKMGSFVYFTCFLLELCSANCPKKSIFYTFMLTSARNLSLLKQFTYVHLKVLITLFLKMVYRGLSHRSWD